MRKLLVVALVVTGAGVIAAPFVLSDSDGDTRDVHAVAVK
jgi:hypothetical protein